MGVVEFERFEDVLVRQDGALEELLRQVCLDIHLLRGGFCLSHGSVRRGVVDKFVACMEESVNISVVESQRNI